MVISSINSSPARSTRTGIILPGDEEINVVHIVIYCQSRVTGRVCRTVINNNHLPWFQCLRRNASQRPADGIRRLIGRDDNANVSELHPI